MSSCLALFGLCIATTGMIVILPDFGRDVHANLNSETWMVNAYMLAVAALVVPGGQLGDIFGRKRLFIVGMILFIVGAAVVAVSSDAGVAIVGRVIQGSGSAAIMPATVSIVDVAFPPTQRRLAMAVWGAVAGLGFGFGPFIAGALAAVASWRVLFWCVIAIDIVALAVTLRTVGESRDEQRSRRIDWVGFLTFGFAALAFVLALEQGDVWGWDSGVTIGIFAAAAASLAAFVLAERRIASPMVHLSIFRSRAFVLGLIGTAVVTWAILAVLFYVSEFFQSFLLLDYSAVRAGVALIPFGAAMLVTSLASASLIDRFGARIVLGLGMVIATVGTWLLTGLEADTTYSGVWLGLLLSGAGIGLVLGPFTGIAVGSVREHLVGEASGVINMSRYLGGILGTASGTIVFAVSAGADLNGLIARMGLGDRRSSLDQVAGGNAVEAQRAVESLGPARRAFSEGAAQALAVGYHDAMTVAAVAMTVGTVITLVMVSNRHKPGPHPPTEVPVEGEPVGESASGGA